MLHLPAIIAHHLTHLPKITQPQFQIQNSDSHFTSIFIGLIFSPLILMAAISKIERAHRMYRDGAYEEALVFYSDALSIAKTNAQKIALHSNRAACFLKLLLFQKAADECTSVLELDINHTGALMLRAQTLVTLKEYQSALFDVNRLLELNPSSEVYQNLQARLKTQLSLAPIPEAETELEDTDNEEDPGEEELEDDDKMAGRGEGETGTTSSFTPESHGTRPSSDPDSNGWQAIPKPKGHSRLDYSRWDSVADDCSDDDDEGDDDEENRPRFRFMVKTVDVRPVK